jgi:predicted RND superfamily exporter protein
MTGSTTVVFAIAFGIAVDDTIHFLSKLKLELARGKELSSALRSTFMVTGKALCLTTLILFFGFVTLVTSSYPATFYIGFILSITLFFALLADLFLIPICLYAFYGTGKKSEAG